jgi:hypothetical protein
MKKIFFLILILFCGAFASGKKPAKMKTGYPKEAIVQAIIDHEKLQPYLHPEVDGRVPLVISDRIIGLHLELKKFDKKVQLVSDKNTTGAFLRFTTFDCKSGNYCNIVFEYPIEGVKGSTGVWINGDGKIQMEKTEIREQ